MRQQRERASLPWPSVGQKTTPPPRPAPWWTCFDQSVSGVAICLTSTTKNLNHRWPHINYWQPDPFPAILAPIPIATCPSWLLLPVGAHRYKLVRVCARVLCLCWSGTNSKESPDRFALSFAHTKNIKAGRRSSTSESLCSRGGSVLTLPAMHSMPVTTVAAAILASKRWENLSGKVAESAWSTETEKRNQLSKQETVSGMEKAN
uniref:HDC11348 n=1 Tax=Drosophila melanogaster TaxID=7227 RepID=Q6IKV6_DROME|nr:TPA_inf: HDC11348 [Drosophila melanogaster]